MRATRQDFLREYRQALLRDYCDGWAALPGRLDRFMQSVADTLAGGNSWLAEGDSLRAAWLMLGGTGRPTLKALRALPETAQGVTA